MAANRRHNTNKSFIFDLPTLTFSAFQWNSRLFMSILKILTFYVDSEKNGTEEGSEREGGRKRALYSEQNFPVSIHDNAIPKTKAEKF